MRRAAPRVALTAVQAVRPPADAHSFKIARPRRRILRDMQCQRSSDRWVVTWLAFMFIGRAQAQSCRPARVPVAAPIAIDSVVRAMGLMDAVGHVRTGPIVDITTLDYQSDRQYPPYLWSNVDGRMSVAWPSAQSRFDRVGGIAIVTDSTRHAVVSPAGGQLVPDRTPNLVDDRALDPWLVLADWRGAASVAVEGECEYRDYWRLVLSNGTGQARDRLFIDRRTWMPVKLERREAHPLWGDVRAEYVWSIWMPAGAGALAPRFAFRLADGEVQYQRQAARYAFAPADSAVDTSIPINVRPLTQLPSLAPDTVRVAEGTFLLRTQSYTNVVTLQSDTVWVLDAQVGEDRARLDSAWIGKLFPGRHPVVVVATDLAHPHISGLRFWVASGASVTSHAMSRAFLGRVIDRKWLLAPDKLERNRARLKLTSVSTVQERAGGRLRIIPIEGIATEGALMVYLPAERFLYASDYVQSGSPASFVVVYARAVASTARELGILPVSFAAMHVPLTPWTDLKRFGVQ